MSKNTRDLYIDMMNGYRIHEVQQVTYVTMTIYQIFTKKGSRIGRIHNLYPHIQDFRVLQERQVQKNGNK